MTLYVGGSIRQAPPASARLNWPHPMCNSLIGLIAGRTVHVGTTRGPLAPAADPTTPTRFGAGFGAGFGATPVLCTLPAQTDTTTFTFAWAGHPTAFLGFYGTGASTQCSLNQGVLSYLDSVGHSSGVNYTEPTKDHLVVVVKNGLVWSAYVVGATGVVKTTGSTTAGQASIAAHSVFYLPDQALSFGGTSFAGVWTRPFSDAEARSLIANPFQMFVV